MVFNRIKRSLSRLRKDSWHGRLVDVVFDLAGKETPKKACTYWWFAVPGSMLATGIACVVVLAAVVIIYPIFFVLANLIYVLGWFFGYRSRSSYFKAVVGLKCFVNSVLNKEFYGYKECVGADGIIKTSKFAPYQYLLMIGSLVGLATLTAFMANGHTPPWIFWIWVIRVLVAIVGLVAIGFLYKKFVHPRISAACPPITWVDE